MPANPFATEAAARLYAAGRPDYSGIVATIVRRLTGIVDPVEVAVDVGSGTGISTVMLAGHARVVIGVEPAAAMVRLARQATNVSYARGAAEAVPLADASCDLIGVGSALHWFDQDVFSSESLRIAKPGAWLVVHDHWFTGRIDGKPEFEEWAHAVYLTTYPSPLRERSWRPPDDLGRWRHVAWERYQHSVTMDAEHLTRYLLTQSNLQVVMERGDQTEHELRTWLTAQLQPILDGDSARLEFGGFVSCLRKAE